MSTVVLNNSNGITSNFSLPQGSEPRGTQLVSGKQFLASLPSWTVSFIDFRNFLPPPA